MMSDRRDTSLDGGLNPEVHVSDVVSSYGGNIVSGRWALANRGMLDQQRTKTSKQSTAQIQAQSLEMEAVHLTSEESTPGADFNQTLVLTPQRSNPVIKYRICTYDQEADFPSTHHNDHSEGLVNCVWREGQDIPVKGTVQVSGELKPGADSSEVKADNQLDQ
ncbi:unnamed protein product [Sphagnum troendelagicum]|uniref:Uncharacterized protein n=1 Tax=Sphagnum troendelagicum TaxID=128251 RepID=A0ABP0U5V3_9BRYO